MRRWTWRILVAVSTVICVILAALWPRSYWVGEWVELEVGYLIDDLPRARIITVRFGLEHGLLSLVRQGALEQPLEGFDLTQWHARYPYFRFEFDHVQTPHWFYWPSMRYPITNLSMLADPPWHGFKFEDPTSDFARISCPAWFAFLLTALLPTIELWKAMHRRRNRVAGLCHVCGYDLRATPDRCPECGTDKLSCDSRAPA